MSWTLILVLAAGSYLFKVTGLMMGTRLTQTPVVTGIAPLLPPALLAALVVVQTLVVDGSVDVVDARALGVAAGAVAVALRAPFIVVVAISAAVAALARAVS